MKFLFGIPILLVLLLAACAPATAPSAPTISAPVANPNTAPTLAPTARSTEKTNPIPQATEIPIATPWSIAIKSALGGAQGFGFAVSVTGASDKTINLRVMQSGKPVPGVTLAPSSGKPPFQVTFTIPGQLFGPAPIVLEADDGSLTRQFTLTPPPPQ